MPSPITAIYNGVELKFARLTSLQQSLVMSSDGTTALYTHVVATISFVVNPVGTRPDQAPRQQAFDHRLTLGGPHMADALRGLRAKLLVPRKKLYINAGTRATIDSPQRAADGRELEVDAVCGPIPVRLNVDEVIGDKTMFCSFTIQTWLAEGCFGVAGQPPPTLLSNRFTQTSDIQYPEFLETRTTRGTAVFRADFLAIRGRNAGLPPFSPADFRGWIMPPPIPGYNRMNAVVTPASDGTSLDYSCTDVEVPRHWGLRNNFFISSCSGHQEYGYQREMAFTKALYQTVHLSVTGYPESTNAHLVSGLIILLETMRNRQGVPLQSRRIFGSVNDAGINFGGLSLRGRAMYHNANIRVDFPRRRAIAHISVRLTGRLAGGLGALGAGALSDLDLYFEDFGPRLGPQNSRQSILQPGSHNNYQGTALTGVFQQVLHDPCTVPPRETGMLPPQNTVPRPQYELEP